MDVDAKAGDMHAATQQPLNAIKVLPWPMKSGHQILAKELSLLFEKEEY